MLHGGMVGGREHEAETDFPHAARDLLRAKVDTRPQRFQYVRAATAAGSGAVAMFGDERACGGGQYTRARRNVEGASAIATCTTGVHSLRRLLFAKMHLHGLGAHDLRQPGYFLDGFAPRTQAQRG